MSTTKDLELAKIDAFAAGASRGNPAGYVRLASREALTAAEMLAVAQQLAGFVSEVAFAFLAEDGTVHLRYFSAEKEVDFCGHATVAVMNAILRSEPALRDCDEVTVATNVGRLTVENRLASEGAVYVVAPPPVKLELPVELKALARAFGVDVTDISQALPIVLIDAGLATLILPITSPDRVLQISPDFDTLRSYCEAVGADIALVYSQGGTSVASDYRTRVFAPRFGYLEDPATGSGNSALGYALRASGLWLTGGLVIEQNAEPEAFNVIRLRLRSDGAGEERVVFGGPAITRLTGTFHLVS